MCTKVQCYLPDLKNHFDRFQCYQNHFFLFLFSFKLEEKCLKLLSCRIQRLLYPHIELHLISVLFHGGKFRKAYQFSVQFCFRRDSKLQVISRFCSYLLQQFYKKTLQSRTATKSDVAQIFV